MVWITLLLALTNSVNVIGSSQSYNFNYIFEVPTFNLNLKLLHLFMSVKLGSVWYSALGAPGLGKTLYFFSAETLLLVEAEKFASSWVGEASRGLLYKTIVRESHE